jgi:hypothetical protein
MNLTVLQPVVRPDACGGLGGGAMLAVGAVEVMSMGSGEQRAAGFALLAFAALNALFGLLGLIGGGPAGVVGLTLVVAAVVAVLGLLVRGGSRSATLVAVALLGVLLAYELVSVVRQPRAQLVIWVLIIAALEVLVFRALRSA